MNANLAWIVHASLAISLVLGVAVYATQDYRLVYLTRTTADTLWRLKLGLRLGLACHVVGHLAYGARWLSSAPLVLVSLFIVRFVLLAASSASALILHSTRQTLVLKSLYLATVFGGLMFEAISYVTPPPAPAPRDAEDEEESSVTSSGVWFLAQLVSTHCLFSSSAGWLYVLFMGLDVVNFVSSGARQVDRRSRRVPVAHVHAS